MMASDPHERTSRTYPKGWANAVFYTRLSMIWEQIWPPLVFAACVLAIGLALIWTGLFAALPLALRIVLLTALAGAALWSLRPLLRLRIPGRQEIIARLDRAADTQHHPIAALADRPANLNISESEAIWHAHRARLQSQLKQVNPAPPAPHMAKRDPYAFRALVLLGFVAAFVVAGGDRIKSIGSLLDTNAAVQADDVRLDAWIAPPAYTGRVPILLTASDDKIIDAPENSEFVLRSNDETLQVEFAAEGSPDADALEAEETKAGRKFSQQLARNGTLIVTSGDTVLYRWAIGIIDDSPPTIAFTEPPSRSRTGASLFHYEYSDDYGVTAARVQFERSETDGNSEPLVEAPSIDLTLQRAKSRQGSGRVSRDLREHPWAGAEVRYQLRADDAAGQSGFSQKYSMTLPQRSFSQPLARALVEQRRYLALDRLAHKRVAQALDALAIAPDEHIKNISHYLGIRTAYWRIRNAKSDDELRGVVDYLWEIALAIEDGVLSLAAQNVRELQRQLAQALEDGASESEIERLMQELRQAMAEMMREMARQQGDMDNMPQLSEQQMQNAVPLDQMLNEIERLARNGARDAAQELLKQLQSMMNNLQMGRAPQQNQQTQDLAETMKELGDLMRRQQELMDQTFKYDPQNPQNGQQNRNGLDQRGSQNSSRQGQQQGGEQGQAQGDHQMGLEDLKKQQQALREALEGLLSRMRERGQNPGENMGEADSAMGDAGKAIGEGDTGQAVGDQQRAMDNLSAGAQQMGQQMQNQMAQGQQGGIGRSGQNDPFGRNRDRDMQDGEQGEGDPNYRVGIPDMLDVEQARRILNELRERLSDPSRLQNEKNYIERLIEGFK